MSRSELGQHGEKLNIRTRQNWTISNKINGEWCCSKELCYKLRSDVPVTFSASSYRFQVRDPDSGQQLQGLHEAEDPERDQGGLHAVQVCRQELAGRLRRNHNTLRY